MLESSGFRKYSTLLVIQSFSPRLCLCHCLCIRLCLCICVLIGLAIVVVVVTIGWCVLELDWEGGYIGDSKMELEIQ